MRLIEGVKAVLADGDQGYDPYECRVCGRSLSSETDACPACGSTEILRIEVG